jgi:hypothetical protein
MLRFVLSVVGGLLLSANAWAVPKAGQGDSNGTALKASTLGVQLCLLLQDPWQDCNEDTWQVSAVLGPGDALYDPWQDAEDPWQPFPGIVPAGASPDTLVDPWQPLVSQLAPAPAHVAPPTPGDDPGQPAFADPWQEGADDPWQVR